MRAGLRLDIDPGPHTLPHPYDTGRNDTMALTPDEKLEVRKLARLEAAAVAGRSALNPTTGRFPNGLGGVNQNAAFDALDAANGGNGGNPFA